jgi:hypothetical protein
MSRESLCATGQPRSGWRALGDLQTRVMVGLSSEYPLRALTVWRA